METNKELGACINGVEVCNNKHLQLLGPWLFMMHYMQKINKKTFISSRSSFDIFWLMKYVAHLTSLPCRNHERCSTQGEVISSYVYIMFLSFAYIPKREDEISVY